MMSTPRAWVCRLVAVALAMVGASPAVGQKPLMPGAARDLQFGVLLPGLETQVPWTDPMMAGRFEIRGTKDAEVRIDVTLPASLISSGGQMVPLQFGSTDAGFGTRPALRQAQVFDPRSPLVTRLGRGGKLLLWLGGRAQPGTTQQSGVYNATITVTVAYTGV